MSFDFINWVAIDQETPTLNSFINKTVLAIEGGKVDDDEMVLVFSDKKLTFCHLQDCCENVRIVDVDGDINDLIGVPLLMCEAVSSEGYGEEREREYEDNSHTWTFYKFATINGYVTVRWLGESNGYYSEEVDICVSKPKGRNKQ